MQRYEPRPIRFDRVREVDGWRLKVYTVTYGTTSVDSSAFGPAMAMVDAALPRPPITPSRHGVGFVILHQGRTALYCVLGWWDNENELSLRVFVRGLESSAEWRPARGAESVCVWDLQIIGFERDAYVATLLTGDADVDEAAGAYVSAVMSREPLESATSGASGAR
jgi:hypothetical protein